MLIQETRSEPDTLLKLLVNLDDQESLQPQPQTPQLPRDARAGKQAFAQRQRSSRR